MQRGDSIAIVPSAWDGSRGAHRRRWIASQPIRLRPRQGTLVAVDGRLARAGRWLRLRSSRLACHPKTTPGVDPVRRASAIADSRVWRGLAIALFVLAPSGGAESTERAFPIQDAFRATVMGTPPEVAARVPENVRTDVKDIERFPDRSVSPIFWAGKKLRYSLSKQKEPAPLAFVIAGTGASWRSSKARFLKRALYAKGFHVVALSSPTSPDFIVAASEHALPGLPEADARDLLAVMDMALAENDDLEILGRVLVGYSLGATQAAFVAEISERESRGRFDRVYLINPSVRLETSASNLDGLYTEALPDGTSSINALVENALAEAAHYARKPQRGPLDAEFIMAAVASRASDIELEAAIGASFRLSSANLSFASDVMNQSGKIVEPGKRLGIGTSLTPYFDQSLGWSFGRYMDELLLPYWEKELGRDRATLIEDASLHRIAGWLRDSDGVAVTTNQDDPILGPGDIEFLRETFGDRATIHPYGGHCGNMEFAPVVAAMLNFLYEPWDAAR